MLVSGSVTARKSGFFHTPCKVGLLTLWVMTARAGEGGVTADTTPGGVTATLFAWLPEGELAAVPAGCSKVRVTVFWLDEGVLPSSWYRKRVDLGFSTTV